MTDYINEVLQEMGCPKGTFVPVANEENRQLIDSISELTNRKQEQTLELQSTETKLQSLRSHFDHSKEEVCTNLKLLSVYKHQVELDSHILKLSENELDSFKMDIVKIGRNFSDTDQLNFDTRVKMEKINLSIKQFSDEIRWARAAFQEFQEAIQKGDESNTLMDSYSKSDRAKTDELEAKRKLLQTKIAKQRTILLANNDQKTSLENVLNRTAQLYRQAHEERRVLIKTWKDAINQMGQREIEINQSERELSKAKLTSEQREKVLSSIIKQHEQQCTNQKELELQIEELNDKTSNERIKLNNFTNSISLKSNELEILKKNIVTVSKDLMKQRQQNRLNSSEKLIKEQLLEEWKGINQSLLERYNTFRSKNYNSLDRLQQLDELIKNEEKNIKVLTVENIRLSEALFKANQRHLEIQNEEKTLEYEVQGIETTMRRMRGIFKTKDEELRRQTMLLYEVNFGMTQTRLRIDRMEGKCVDLDNDCLDRLMQLEQSFIDKKKAVTRIQSEINQLQEDIKRMSTYFNQDQTELDKLKGTLKEKILLCDSGEKKIKMKVLENQERLVEENFLKMKVKQLEKFLQSQENKIFNLTRYKDSIEASINQRLVELKAQSKVSMEKRKHINENRQKLRLEISEHSVKLENLKRRYIIILDLMTKNDHGEVMNGAQIKIKIAQEKKILLDEGNKLNAKVIKAESDLKAMENTLRLISNSNETYKRNVLENGQTTSVVSEELNSLRQTYAKELAKLKGLQTNMILKSEQIVMATNQMEILERELNYIIRTRLDNTDVLTKVQKDLADQNVKKIRSERDLKITYKKVKSRINDREFMEQLEREMKANEIEESNSNALQKLADLVDSHPDMGTSVAQLLYEKKLAVPASVRVKSHTSEGSHVELNRLAKDESSASSLEGGLIGGIRLSPSIVMIDFPMQAASRRTGRNKISNLRK